MSNYKEESLEDLQTKFSIAQFSFTPSRSGKSALQLLSSPEDVITLR